MRGEQIYKTRISAERIVQSSHAARAATRRYGTAEASREMRIRVHQTAAHASRGGHSRPAGWRRGGRRRAAGGGGRGRGTGRGAAVRSESWIRSQARARACYARELDSARAHTSAQLTQATQAPRHAREKDPLKQAPHQAPLVLNHLLDLSFLRQVPQSD